VIQQAKTISFCLLISFLCLFLLRSIQFSFKLRMKQLQFLIQVVPREENIEFTEKVYLLDILKELKNFFCFDTPLE